MPESFKKPKQDDAPPKILLWEYQLELHTEFSFDECVDRFQDAAKESKSEFAPRIKVDVSSADANAMRFNMHIGHGFVKSWLVAHFEHLGDGSTTVRGVVGVDPSIIVLFAFMLVIPIGALIFTQSFIALLMGALFTVTGIVFLYFSSNDLKHDLIEKLETVLPA